MQIIAEVGEQTGVPQDAEEMGVNADVIKKILPHYEGGVVVSYYIYIGTTVEFTITPQEFTRIVNLF